MSEDTGQAEPGPDEVFCTDCGEIIKQRAEICPNCGVRQASDESNGGQEPAAGDQGSGLTDRRQYELEKVANQSAGTVILVALLLTPAAYWMIGKKTLAIVNFLTLNYLLMGFIIVPIHCYKLINDAEEELRRAGVPGY